MSLSNETHHDWQIATIADRWQESGEAIGLRLQLENKPPHLAGQHLDVRLTGEDGYQAVRAYSIASADDGSMFFDLGVQVLEGGEVSGYLGSYAKPGMQLEIKLAGSHYFTWHPEDPTPTMLLGGGSGIVPLVAMWRTHQQAATPAPMRVLYSVRQPESLMYAALWDDPNTFLSFTNVAPEGWTGYRRIFDAEMLHETVGESKQFFICGPTPFVEAVSSKLVEVGYAPESIKTERFGPTGPRKP